MGNISASSARESNLLIQRVPLGYLSVLITEVQRVYGASNPVLRALTGGPNVACRI